MERPGKDRIQIRIMTSKKKEIIAINGSASAHSSNERLIEQFKRTVEEEYAVTVWPDLKAIPHFDPELAAGDAPPEVRDLRDAIGGSEAVVICTPEYIYSIPSGLKNVLEWCVATTIFTDKQVAIITASASGQKGHEELQLILRTLGAKTSDGTCLLIQGIKGKIDDRGEFKDEETARSFQQFVDSFRRWLRPG